MNIRKQAQALKQQMKSGEGAYKPKTFEELNTEVEAMVQETINSVPKFQRREVQPIVYTPAAQNANLPQNNQNGGMTFADALGTVKTELDKNGAGKQEKKKTVNKLTDLNSFVKSKTPQEKNNVSQLKNIIADQKAQDEARKNFIGPIQQPDKTEARDIRVRQQYKARTTKQPIDVGEKTVLLSPNETIKIQNETEKKLRGEKTDYVPKTADEKAYADYITKNIQPQIAREQRNKEYEQASPIKEFGMRTADTVRNAWNNFYAGAAKTSSNFYSLLGLNGAMGENIFTELANEQDKAAEYANLRSRSLKDNPDSVLNQIIDSTFQSVPRMALDGFLAMMTGGATSASTAATEALAAIAPNATTTGGYVISSLANKIGQAIKLPKYMIPMFADQAISSYRDAISDGKPQWQAITFGLTNGYLNALLEGGGIEESFANTAKNRLQQRILSDSDDVLKKAFKTTANKLSPALKEWASSTIEEGLEEVTQSITEKALRSIQLQEDYGKFFKTGFDNGEDNAFINLREELINFAGGALGGAAFGGINLASSIVNNQIVSSANKRTAIKNIDREINNTQKYISELENYAKTDVKNKSGYTVQIKAANDYISDLNRYKSNIKSKNPTAEANLATDTQYESIAEFNPNYYDSQAKQYVRADKNENGTYTVKYFNGSYITKTSGKMYQRYISVENNAFLRDNLNTLINEENSIAQKAGNADTKENMNTAAKTETVVPRTVAQSSESTVDETVQKADVGSQVPNANNDQQHTFETPLNSSSANTDMTQNGGDVNGNFAQNAENNSETVKNGGEKRHFNADYAKSSVREFGRILGVNVEFSDNLDKNVDGMYYTKDGQPTIVIANETTDPIMTVFKHELTHSFQVTDPEAYAEYKKYVIDKLQAYNPEIYKEHFNSLWEKYCKQYNADTRNGRIIKTVKNENGTVNYVTDKNGMFVYDGEKRVTAADIEDEIAARATESFLTDEKGIAFQKMADKNPNAAKGFINALRSMILRLVQFSQQLKKRFAGAFNTKAETEMLRADINTFREAERMFTDMLEERYNANPNNAKTPYTDKSAAANTEIENERPKQLFKDYSAVTESILNVSDKAAKEYADNRIAVEVSDHTPDVILNNVEGAKDLRIIMNYAKLYLAVRKDGVFKGHYHNLGAETAKKLPDILANPDAIIQLGNGRLNIFSTIKTDKGNNGIISVELNSTKDIEGKYQDYNVVVTMFSSDDKYVKNLLSGENVDVKYKKEDLSQVNPQLYKWLAIINDKSSADNSISQNDTFVNSSIRNNSANDTTADFNAEKIESIVDDIIDYSAKFAGVDNTKVQKIVNAVTSLSNAHLYSGKEISADMRQSVEDNINTLRDSLKNGNLTVKVADGIKYIADMAENALNSKERFSIQENEKGKYVQADRQVIHSDNDYSKMFEIMNYVKDKVMHGDTLDVTLDDGETISITGRTAWKLADKGHFGDDFYLVKGNAAGVIDEIVQVSKFVNKKDSKKEHSNNFGSKGFEYRSAYFRDLDGKYYRLKLSIGINENGKEAYNIGEIKEIPFPGKSVNGSKAQKKRYSLDTSIPQNDNSFNSNYMQKSDNYSVQSDDKPKFSLAEPVEETKDLIAVHNLSQEKLEGDLDLGGIPMPSIAVTKADIGHEGFGDITVLFRKDTIDPTLNKENKIYGGDAYTPMFPTVDYKANSEVIDKISKKYSQLYSEYGYEACRALSKYADMNNAEDILNRTKGEKGLINNAKDDVNLMQTFLYDAGIGKIDTVEKTTKTRIKDAEADKYDYFIEKLGKSAFEDLTKREPGTSVFAAKKAWAEKYMAQFDKALTDYYSEKFGFSKEETSNILNAETNASKIDMARAILKYIHNGKETVKTEPDYAATNEKIRKTARENGFDEWVDGLLSGIEQGKGIYNGKDPYTASGNRRSFAQLYDEFTLENVVNNMRKQLGKGQSSLFAGANNVQGAATKEYKSIDEMKREKGRISTLNQTEIDNIKNDFSDRLNNIIERACKNPEQYGNALNDFSDLIIEGLNKTKTPEAFRMYLTKEGNGFYNITKDICDDVLSLVNDMREVPVKYFEAKPQRAIDFNEVEAVIVPNNTDESFINELENKGLNVVKYGEGENDRINTVNEVADKLDIKFSLADDSDTSGIFTPNKTEAQRYNAQVDEWINGKMKSSDLFKLGRTPVVLRELGARDLPIVMSQDVMVKVTGGKHSISLDELKQLPKAIADPIMAFKSATVNNAYVILTELTDKYGNDVVVAMHLNRFNYENRINRIASVYGKENIGNFVKEQIEVGNLKYIDKNKSQTWSICRGLQLPKLNTMLDSNNSILQKEDIVNRYSAQNTNKNTVNMNKPDPDKHIIDKIVSGKEPKLSLKEEKAYKRLEDTNKLLREHFKLTPGEKVTEEHALNLAKKYVKQYGLVYDTADYANKIKEIINHEFVSDIDKFIDEQHKRLSDIKGKLDDSLAAEEKNNIEKQIKSIEKQLKNLKEKRKNLVQQLSKQHSSEYNIFEELQAVNAEMLENAKALDTTISDQYKDLAATLKKGVQVSDEMKSNITDYKDFKASVRNSLTLKKDSGSDVDKLYQELAEQYPEFFGNDIINPVDRLFKLAEVSQAIKPQIITPEYGTASIKDIADIITAEMLDELTPQTKMGKRVNELKYKLGETKRAMRAQAEHLKREGDLRVAFAVDKESAKLEKYKAERKNKAARDYLFNALDKLSKMDTRSINNKKSDGARKSLSNEIARINEAIEKNTEKLGGNLSDMERTKIQRHLAMLKNMLAKKSAVLKNLGDMKENGVDFEAQKAELMRNITAVAQSNIDSAVAEINNLIAEQNKKISELKEKLGGNLPQNVLEQTGKKIKALEAKRDKLLQQASKKQNEGGDNINVYKALKESDIDTLTDFAKDVLNLQNDIRTYGKALKNAKTADLHAIADKIAREQEDYSKLRSKNGNKKNTFAESLKTRIMFDVLSPMRVARMVSGYNENAELMRIFNDINAGQEDVRKFKYQANKMFEDAFKGAKISLIDTINKLSGRRADTVKFRADGKEYEITKGMRISLYLHSLNKSNMFHIEHGGIIIPNIKEFKKGNPKAFDNDFRSESIKLTAEDVRSIISGMSKEEKLYAQVAHKFFNEKAKNAINARSEYLVGYDIADVTDYFPIVTERTVSDIMLDKNPLLSSMYMDSTGEYKEDKSGIASIEGRGEYKSRVKGSSTPIMLEDVYSVVKRHIKNTAQYYGMSMPLRNLTEVLNTFTFSDGRFKTVSAILEKHWGSGFTKWLTNLRKDLNFGRKNESDTIIGKVTDKLTGNYAGAVLTGNLSVILKQTASYPTAIAELGPEAIARGFADMSKITDEFINSLTGIYAARGNGVSDVSFEDVLKENPIVQKSPTVLRSFAKGIEAADKITVKKLFKAAMWSVKLSDSQYKNMDMETAMQNDDFKAKVVDAYIRTVENTQPMYDTMQRNVIQRTPDKLAKFLFPFMTQRFQNLGIMLDAVGNYKAKRLEYKANKNSTTEANLKEARKRFIWAVQSRLIANVMMTGINALWKMLRDRTSEWKDDDDKTDKSKVMAWSIDDFLKNNIGDIPLGGTVYDVITTTGEYIANAFLDKYDSDFKFDVKLGYSYIDEVEIASVNLLNEIFQIPIYFAQNVGKRTVMDNIISNTTVVSRTIGVPADSVKNIYLVTLNTIRQGRKLLGMDTTEYDFRAKSLEWKVNEKNASKFYEYSNRAFLNYLKSGKKSDLKIYNDISDELIKGGISQDKIESKAYKYAFDKNEVLSNVINDDKYFNRLLKQVEVSVLPKYADIDTENKATSGLVKKFTELQYKDFEKSFNSELKNIAKDKGTFDASSGKWENSGRSMIEAYVAAELKTRLKQYYGYADKEGNKNGEVIQADFDKYVKLKKSGEYKEANSIEKHLNACGYATELKKYLRKNK